MKPYFTHIIWLNLRPKIAEKILNDSNPRTVEESELAAVNIGREVKILMPKSSSSIASVNKTKQSLLSASWPDIRPETLY